MEGTEKFNGAIRFVAKRLKKQLESHKVSKAAEVFCMTADKQGEVVIIPTDKRKDGKK